MNRNKPSRFFSPNGRALCDSDCSEEYLYSVRYRRLSEILRLVIENELSQTERVVVRKLYFEEKNITTTALELKVCPSTVYRTLCRAEKKIEKYMKYALFALDGRPPSDDLKNLK